MPLDEINKELRDVFGGLLRHASDDRRLSLLELTSDQWRQAAFFHDFLHKTTVLLSLSPEAKEAVHDRDINVAELVKSVHRDILQAEHDCQQAELGTQATEAVNRLLVRHFGNPGLTADDQAADLQHALGFSRSRLEEAMKEAFKAGHTAAHHS